MNDVTETQNSLSQESRDHGLASVFLCHTGYPLMSKALNATGRPIAYSCSWPAYLGGLPPTVSVITTSLSNYVVGRLEFGTVPIFLNKTGYFTALRLETS